MSKKFPLVVEQHPDDYEGYKFITLIRFNDASSLNIVDNVSKKYIHAYVIDLCDPEGYDEDKLIQTAYEWYNTNSTRFPLSIELSRRNMTNEVQGILRAYPIDYVTRVIGPLPQFDMEGPIKVRKRKRKDIPSGVEIINNSTTIKF